MMTLLLLSLLSRMRSSPACIASSLVILLPVSLPASTGAFAAVRSCSRRPNARAQFPLSLFQSTKQQRQEETTPTSWKPTVTSLSDRKTYFREQSKYNAETLGTLGFHHVEFYTGDALMTAKRFELALGIPITCWSSLATGNDVCVTYGLECGADLVSSETEPGAGVRFLITAPLGRVQGPSSVTGVGSNCGGAGSNVQMTAPLPFPGYDIDAAHEFHSRHGLAVRAVGIEVEDAVAAYEAAVANGAVGLLEPTPVSSSNGGGDDEMRGKCATAEVELYGDVVLRFVSFAKGIDSRRKSKSNFEGDDQPTPFLPHLAAYPSCKMNRPTYGLSRIDHTVGNVPNLLATQRYIQRFTGYHPFAEFTPEDVGTVDSGLNSVVLASDSEAVLLPINEPTKGKRKSQIQTYLEQNAGPGLQHIAIKTNDIFYTISKMRHAAEHFGGFELMVRPSEGYYSDLPSRLGDKLTLEQYEQLEELGILADADEEGVLLQIFTKPLGDRPTLFLEIIQRIGCALDDGMVGGKGGSSKARIGSVKERPGCGGFGQGNFRELFKAIEDHEKTLKV